jgi:phosphatidylglycerophosphatase C
MPEVNHAEASTATARSERPVVAAFDFDGTLTHRDTLLPFLIRCLGWPQFLWVLCQSSPWLAAYALRLMSNHRAKARLLKVSLIGLSQLDAQAQAQAFVTGYLPTQWQPWAMAQLLQHQHQGHHCIVVSASPDVYLSAVAASLGVDALLCTEMVLRDGRYTGAMATPNCHGGEKVIRLQAWLREMYTTDTKPVIHAYGDTPGDFPMLRLAERAWYRGKPWSGRDRD